jgi:GrpB-like predicted nucleotidyltransferase (UPF0157 family)
MSDGGTMPPRSPGRPLLAAVAALAPDPGAAAPPAPSHMRLRRAAELVEEVAFEMAGRASPQAVSRLIEIAAELDRHARGRMAEAPAPFVPRPPSSDS